jgi:hypothetical protein
MLESRRDQTRRRGVWGTRSRRTRGHGDAGRRGHRTLRVPRVLLVGPLQAAVLILINLTQACPCAAEKDPQVSYGAEYDSNTRYVWRGIRLSDGGVTQPSLWIEHSRATLTLWGNMPIGSSGSVTSSLDELDVTLSYKTRVAKWELEPSFLLYVYPGQEAAPTTGEAMVRFSFPVGSTQVFTIHSLDLVRYPGAYFGEAGVALEREWGAKASLEAALRVGWGSASFNRDYMDVPKGACNYVGGDVSVTRSLGRSLYVRPHLGFSRLIDRDLRRKTASANNLVIGLAMGHSF